ncbi:MAG: hypothetical protein Q7W30_06725 [Coriobacteriia bacterium]|nr:hypothetical protein [Coriobacteriia bacterium]
MQRKWLLIGGAVVVVAGLLVGAQLLSARSPRTDASGAGTAPGASAPVGGSGIPGSPGSSAASAGVDPSGTTEADLSPGSQAYPPANAGLKPVAPKGPLPAGQPLPPLASSPPGIISGFATGRVPDGSAYTVTFRPWGTGPSGPKGPTIAAQIDSMVPLGVAPDVSLSGRTVLLVTDLRGAGRVSTGGTWQGVMTFVEDGKSLVPVVAQCAPVSQ